MERYGLKPRKSADAEAGDAAGGGTGAAAKSTNELDNLKVKFRAVNLSKATSDSSANGKLAFVVENAVKSSVYFDKDGSKLDGQLEIGENDTTFTFGMVLKLRTPGAQPTAAKKK